MYICFIQGDPGEAGGVQREQQAVADSPELAAVHLGVVPVSNPTSKYSYVLVFIVNTDTTQN